MMDEVEIRKEKMRQMLAKKTDASYEELIKKLEEIGFFEAPASTKYHGSYEGGLFEHSYLVAETLNKMTEQMGLEWRRKESPVLVGLLHDVCKCDAYKKIEDGYVYNKETLYAGHGDKSVMIAVSIANLDDEMIACIRYHMGSFTEKEEWNYYSRAVRRYKNVLWTHAADMYVSNVLEV